MLKPSNAEANPGVSGSSERGEKLINTVYNQGPVVAGGSRAVLEVTMT